MIDDVKGYVVRGTWDTGAVVCHVPGGFWNDRPPHVFREFAYASSQRGLMLQQGCSNVAIYRVHADGREERLPSYEEALAEIERLRAIEALNVGAIDASLVRLGAVTGAIGPMPADPLAALEAAERRLLEAGGWVRIHGDPSKWTWPQTGIVMAQDQAVIVARRRLAAKGGA